MGCEMATILSRLRCVKFNQWTCCGYDVSHFVQNNTFLSKVNKSLCSDIVVAMFSSGSRHLWYQHFSCNYSHLNWIRNRMACLTYSCIQTRRTAITGDKLQVLLDKNRWFVKFSMIITRHTSDISDINWYFMCRPLTKWRGFSCVSSRDVEDYALAITHADSWGPSGSILNSETWNGLW